MIPDSSMIRYLVSVRCYGRAFWRTSRYRLFGACIKEILAIVSLNPASWARPSVLRRDRDLRLGFIDEFRSIQKNGRLQLVVCRRPTLRRIRLTFLGEMESRAATRDTFLPSRNQT